MTKAKISEYDAVAANNTDVNGVNIAEGCPPSGMNNMGREIMAALKRFQTGADGDSVTVGGSLVVSGTATTNTLTAGPVSATTLNTSGAVVFNDAGADVDFRVEGDTDANLLFVDASADKVGIGTNTPATLLDVSSSTTNTGRLRVTGTGSTTGNYRGYEFAGGSGFSGGLFQDEGTGALSIWSSPSGESIRIDASGNVGIGINAPTATLDVRGNANFLATDNATTRTILLGPSDYVSSTKYLAVQWSHAASAALYYTQGAFPHIFYTNNTERARITGGGSFLVGTTTSGTPTGITTSSAADSPSFFNFNSNASLTSTEEVIAANRSANSAYYFLGCVSNRTAIDNATGQDIEFLLRGDGNAYADGSWNGSGADYAEYFESAGETIPRGTTVVLDNNKVRAATENDSASSIIGVVRPKEFGKGSMVVGNLAWNMWTDKYLTDDFGVYEMEDHDVLEWEEQVLETEATEAVVDEEGNEVSPAQEAVYKTVNHSYESHAVPEGVTVPADATRKTHDEKGKKFQHRKLNPTWSADVEYTPREERPEWHIIGLLGQVPVLKGQPVGDRWIKMRDISETVEEWFIR